MPDDAEGQRLNPLVDMSKLSLGRMKHVQIVYLNRIIYLWIQDQLALKHFVLSKVRTLLNKADYLTKQ